jgi:hypothetical protein
MSRRDNIVKWSIVSIFVALYAMVSIISTIHVIDFFRLSNPEWLAVTLAISFEIGAAACLGAIVILDRTSRWLVWSLFIIITGMQMMGNMYYAYSHLENFQSWAELFAINEEEPIFQKRILSLVSGAILPIVALGFIKSLVDYIRPSKNEEIVIDKPIEDSVIEEPKEETKTKSQKVADSVWENVKRLRDEGKLPHITDEDLRDEPTALAFTPYLTEEEEEKSLEEDLEATLQDGLEEIEKEELEEIIEQMDKTIIDLTPEKKDDDKIKEVERKIATAIAKNPELKEKISEEIKKMDEGDKYTKKEENSPIANINVDTRRTFGGL